MRETLTPQKPALFRVGTVLTFVSALLTAAVSLVYFYSAYMSWGYRPMWVSGGNIYFVYYLATAIVGVAAAVLGLVAGAFLWRQKRRRLSFLGLGLLVVAGALMMFPLYFFGLPLLVLALAAIVFVAASKAQFQ
jgi:hypothetical protein